jgi:phage gp29-like protein
VVALASRSKIRRPSQLLDAQGVPFSARATRRTVIGNPRGIETNNTHPAFGLTVEILISYFRQAERGQPLRQFDCFDDLVEVSGHLRGLINDRNEDVSGCDFVVLPGRPDKASELAAGALNERLQNKLQFRNFLSHQLTSVPYGFAATNLVWDLEEAVVAPCEFINPAHRRFASPGQDRADEIWLINGTDADTLNLIALEQGLWAVTRYRGRNPWSAGLMRTAAFWENAKRTGFRDWQVFADMFGLPLAIGYYEEGAGEASRLALEEAVKFIGEDGYAVLSALTELVIKETARGGDSSTVYPQLIKLCEDQQSKLFTGGTLNTDTNGVGSYNAASVHESRGYKMKRRDAKTLDEMFVECIGTPFVTWNGYDRAAPPRLHISLTRDELQRAQTLEILGQAIELDEGQIREEFSLRTPAKGQGVKFAPTAPPDPGKARPEKK